MDALDMVGFSCAAPPEPKISYGHTHMRTRRHAPNDTNYYYYDDYYDYYDYYFYLYYENYYYYYYYYYDTYYSYYGY